MPRTLCGLWSPGQIALHVVSDVIIWLSYLWIPMIMIVSCLKNRKTIRLHHTMQFLVLLYVIFITACGWTHFFDALMFYHPVYNINGVVRAVTAVASLGTAVTMVWLIPRAVTAPVTIMTQRAALHQQHAWLRDILDSATTGVLKLCETVQELPPTRVGNVAPITVTAKADLRAARKAVRQAAHSAGFDDARAHDLMTAAHEGTMNALRNAGGAVVSVHGTTDAVQIWIKDTGPGILWTSCLSQP